MDKILILDFGSQTTALIGRRIREINIYVEVIPGDSVLDAAALRDVRGIILSGSPESVYEAGAAPDRRIYECGLPLLGICYGLQRMTVDLGGKVAALPSREYGAIQVRFASKQRASNSKPNFYAYDFFAGFCEQKTATRWPAFLLPRKEDATFTAWMSHSDTLVELAPDFFEAAASATGYPAIVYHKEKPWFGLQFHPEVSHCERGGDILRSFALGVCKCAQDWTMTRYLDEETARLKTRVGGKTTLLLVSGGVDSTVAAALLLRALPAAQIHLMYVDTGLMRKAETEEVSRTLTRLGAEHIHIVHAENEFLAALAGIEAPEEKRKIIGDLFMTIQEREVAKLSLPSDYYLAQGTLYTDLIESGKGVGNKAHLIKSHHNVGSPLVEAKRAANRILEPLDRLYKDEARELGRLLAVEDAVLRRHPFPGPGLAVRILGEVTGEKCRILREADAIFIEELKKRRGKTAGKSLYDEIWQAFAALLPVRSTGVAGDVRKYGWVLVLRAVTSADGMTAGVYPFNIEDILEISTRITNAVPEIGRVTLDISSKPPATIEWE